MKELIKITEKDGKQAVSARELYDYLHDDNSQFGRFVSSKIVNNEFAVEGVDYQRFDIIVDTPNGGRRTLSDYVLSIEFAKKIAMIAKTSKGEEIREYFIECEKQIQRQHQLPDFSNPAIAARAWADQYEQREIAEARVKQLEPKAQTYDQLMSSDVAISFGQFGKMIGMGRNNLFKECRQRGYLIPKGKEKNNPYQKYIDQGYFEVIETPINISDDKTLISQQTLITPKGQEWLSKRIKNQEKQ
jgi:anti-repressor protein